MNKKKGNHSINRMTFLEVWETFLILGIINFNFVDLKKMTKTVVFLGF